MHSVGNYQGNELTRNSSSNTHPQSFHLCEPLWTDSGVKSGISGRELISTFFFKTWAGNESPILPKKKKSSQRGKKPPNNSPNDFRVSRYLGLIPRSDHRHPHRIVLHPLQISARGTRSNVIGRQGVFNKTAFISISATMLADCGATEPTAELLSQSHALFFIARRLCTLEPR